MVKPIPSPATQPIFCTKANGYRGIWHGQTPTHDEYVIATLFYAMRFDNCRR